jgi:hypothetical protein
MELWVTCFRKYRHFELWKLSITELDATPCLIFPIMFQEIQIFILILETFYNWIRFHTLLNISNNFSGITDLFYFWKLFITELDFTPYLIFWIIFQEIQTFLIMETFYNWIGRHALLNISHNVSGNTDFFLILETFYNWIRFHTLLNISNNFSGNTNIFLILETFYNWIRFHALLNISRNVSGNTDFCNFGNFP